MVTSIKHRNQTIDGTELSAIATFKNLRSLVLCELVPRHGFDDSWEWMLQQCSQIDKVRIESSSLEQRHLSCLVQQLRLKSLSLESTILSVGSASSPLCLFDRSDGSKTCESLRHLSIVRCSGPMTLAGLDRATNLTHVTLKGNLFAIASSSSSSHSNPSLGTNGATHLDDDNDEATSELCKVLSQWRRLLHLDLSCVQSSPRVLETIARSCRKLESLQVHFLIPSQSREFEMQEAIREVLRSCTKLHSLSLLGVSFSSRGTMTALDTRRSQSGASLHSTLDSLSVSQSRDIFDLRNLSLGAGYMLSDEILLHQYLACCPNLQRLSFQGSPSITTTGMPGAPSLCMLVAVRFIMLLWLYRMSCRNRGVVEAATNDRRTRRRKLSASNAHAGDRRRSAIVSTPRGAVLLPRAFALHQPCLAVFELAVVGHCRSTGDTLADARPPGAPCQWLPDALCTRCPQLSLW